mmetsp:Transcript_41055/g.95894  ORF Transcript_41055/g.95894 Transcript_41055/m.95894 type:complete len:300 (-) Transcript_41055:206-1105(-)
MRTRLVIRSSRTCRSIVDLSFSLVSWPLLGSFVASTSSFSGARSSGASSSLNSLVPKSACGRTLLSRTNPSRSPPNPRSSTSSSENGTFAAYNISSRHHARFQYSFHAFALYPSATPPTAPSMSLLLLNPSQSSPSGHSSSTTGVTTMSHRPTSLIMLSFSSSAGFSPSWSMHAKSIQITTLPSSFGIHPSACMRCNAATRSLYLGCPARSGCPSSFPSGLWSSLGGWKPAPGHHDDSQRWLTKILNVSSPKSVAWTVSPSLDRGILPKLSTFLNGRNLIPLVAWNAERMPTWPVPPAP